MPVHTETRGPVLVVTIDRPEVKNAVDGPTAHELHDRFVAFDTDPELAVAVLTGGGGTFCSGADLSAIVDDRSRVNPVTADDANHIVGTVGPMGPTRLALSKPVIAAVEGYAVAGGLELALWCDLRVAAHDAVFGVYCRRWGVPLVDGGTVRLPRLVGLSHALDLILTGRGVSGDEAATMGIANRIVPTGQALAEACRMAEALAALPQVCLRSDRRSALDQVDLPLGAALANETALGLATLATGEAQAGASRFVAGAGRHGATEESAS